MRSLGNQRERAVADDLDALGYHVIAVRASGYRGAHLRERKNPVIGDLLAIPADREAQMPWLQIEVGGAAKRAAAELRELRESLLPGFSPLVVIFRDRKRHYFIEAGKAIASLEAALAALKAA